jgi:hypothetical protein
MSTKHAGIRHDVIWHDGKREPQCPPNPTYPKGVDLDASHGAERTCTVKLEYPAPRCGAYSIRCNVCGVTAACTTAGRPDDPRSVKLACKEPIQ